MGKIGSNSLLMAMKNVFISPKKDNNEKRSSKKRDHQGQDYFEEKKRTKGRWIFQKALPYVTTIQHHVPRSITLGEYLETIASPDALTYPQQRTLPFTLASPPAAEVATATATATADVVRITDNVQHNAASVVVQTAFRGYLARRALAALKGIVKLQALIRGDNVRMQAQTTFYGIQALIRVQTQVCRQRTNLLYERNLASQFNNANCIQGSDTAGLILSNTKGTNLEDVDGDDEYLAMKIHELLQNTKELLKDVKTTLSMPSPSSQEMWSFGKDQTSAKDGKQKENVGYFGEKKNKQRAKIIRTPYEENEDIKIVKIDTFQGRSSSYTASSPLKREHHVPAARSPIKKFAIKMRQTQDYSGSTGSPKEVRSYSAPQTPTAGLRFLQKVTRREENCVPATASASASAGSPGAPRQRPQTPEKDRNVSLKKLSSSTAHLAIDC